MRCRLCAKTLTNTGRSAPGGGGRDRLPTLPHTGDRCDLWRETRAPPRQWRDAIGSTANMHTGLREARASSSRWAGITKQCAEPVTDLWTVRWTLFVCWTILAECQFS